MKKIINTKNAPAPIGPYNQAIKSGPLLFSSGQIPIDSSTGKMVEGGIREQTLQVMKNLKSVLEAGGSSLDHVIKTTVLLADMADFPELNIIYAEFFSEDNAPARSTFQVAALPMGALVEIELVAEVL